jgi:predicted RNA-binding protein with TRAM domain
MAMRTEAATGGRRMEWGMSYSGSGFRPTNVPVEEGKVYEAKIEDIGREGDGLARIQNFVVFVPGTKVGDAVKIRITKVHRRMAFGEVLKE